MDDANKYLFTRAIAAGEWARPSFPYPGHALDPERARVPIPPPFADVWRGRLVSIFPPAFPFVSALAYRAVGPHGLYVRPILPARLDTPGAFR